MSNIEKVDELLQAFIKEFPMLENSKKLMERNATNLDNNIGLRDFEYKLSEGYKQFENWLNCLFEQEKVPNNIIAINFGLYESEDGIQLYISGSTEWELDDEDWANNNDYFPEGRYAEITLYNELYNFWEDNFELGIFLTLSSTVIFV